MPANRHDMIGVAPLIEDVAFDALIANKAFDANWITAELNERGAKVVISQRHNRLEHFEWRLNLGIPKSVGS